MVFPLQSGSMSARTSVSVRSIQTSGAGTESAYPPAFRKHIQNKTKTPLNIPFVLFLVCIRAGVWLLYSQMNVEALTFNASQIAFKSSAYIVLLPFSIAFNVLLDMLEDFAMLICFIPRSSIYLRTFS